MEVSEEMRKITIEIYEDQEDGLTKVFINKGSELEHESHFRKITDVSKQVLIALADYFGYEPANILDFWDDNFDIDNLDDEDDFLESLTDEAETDEMIYHWLGMLLESVNKFDLDDLTAEEIKYEIDQVEGTISNESMWTNGDGLHEKNIEQLEEYLEMLKTMLKARK